MDVNTMVTTVKAYIKEKKGVDVEINMAQFSFHSNIMLLLQAYNTANEYFESLKEKDKGG